MRLLQRRNREREAPLLSALLAHRDRAFPEALEHEADDFLERLFRLRRIDVEEAHLRAERATAERELQPPAAHLVEHADLFEQPQGMIERRDGHHGPEAQALRALRHRREEHGGRRRHSERREMVLGDMIGVKARALVGLHDLQALAVEALVRTVAEVEVIEDAEFHAGSYPTARLPFSER